MPNLGPTELIIIAVVIMLLFGAKKMPDAARSLGRSMRIFKAETKGMRGEDDDGKDKDKQQQASHSEQPTQSSQPQELPPGNDGTTINGRPLSETERTHESR